MWADYSAKTGCAITGRLRDVPASDAAVPTHGQHEVRLAELAPQSIPAWAPTCLAAQQGGPARRAAQSSQPKYRNRILTARKQRFLPAVHSC